MPVTFKHPWMGIAIPSIIILYLQISTTYVIFNDPINLKSRWFLFFQFSNIMLWISYYLAIVTPAGSPKDDFQLPDSEFKQPQTMWRKYCVKCKNYKPERTHHCKKCGKCILRMDHHCPWTNNCIGYNNLPHFMRFLVWILVTITYGFIYFCGRIWKLIQIKNLPSYFISTSFLTIIVINILLISFVLLTISILFIRCVASIISNQTMIEQWECERIQDNFFTEKFWEDVRSNYSKLYPDKPDPIPNLKTWKVNYRELKKNTKIPWNFTYEDLVFPYDLGSSYENLVDSLGPIYLWMYPLGHASGDGTVFVKDKLKEDQLNLPFPPDGSNSDPADFIDFNAVNEDTIDDFNEKTVKSWSNFMGETLDDFGVDLETEDYELSKSK